MSEQLFKNLGKVHQFFQGRDWLNKPIQRMLEKLTPTDTKEDLAWSEEADLAILEQAPLRAKKILYWMMGVLVVLLVWSGFTKIDSIPLSVAVKDAKISIYDPWLPITDKSKTLALLP